MYEIATTSDSSRKEDIARKLRNLCLNNPGQIYSGKDPAQLIREQKGQVHKLRAGSIVNQLSSRYTQNPNTNTVDDWADMLDVIANSTAANMYLSRKVYLKEVARIFSSYLELHAPDRLKSIRSHKTNTHELALEDSLHPVAIQQFSRILLRDGEEPRYLSQDWQRALADRPNDFALGRLARLFIWYCYVGAANHDGRNSMEDMQYVFLASYTNSLVTEDNGMKEAAKILWPKINCLSSTECFTS